MKKRFLSLMLALVLCLGLTVPAIAAENAGEAADVPVVEVIPCQYLIAGSFSDGLAAVQTNANGKLGFMDKTGKVVIPCKYDIVNDFSEGLALVFQNGQGGFIDKTGKTVIPFQYDDAISFSDGLAAVMRDGKWGYIDKTGKEVVPCTYDAARQFSEGLAVVVQDDKWGFIDKTGKEVIPCKYDGLQDFSEGLAGANLNDKRGFIDKTGKEVVPFQYDSVEAFSEGLAMVEKNKKFGFVDQTGKEVVPCKYNGAGDFIEGFGLVLQNGKWGFIDKTGKVVIPCKYEDAWQFSDGLALVVRNGKGGFIDTTGKEVVPCKYDGASDFSEGFAPVMREINGNVAWGYIDKTGKEVVPCTTEDDGWYVDAYIVSDGMARVARLGEKVEGTDDEYYNVYGYLAIGGGTEESKQPEEPTVTAKVSGWAKEQVDSAAASGLIADGLGEDYTKSITRAQFAAVTVKLYEAMSGQTAPAAGDSPFSDTSDPAVIQAEALGFVGGVGGGKFDPDSPVTREQAAVMLSRVYTKLGGEIPTVDATGFDDDDSMSGDAKNAIAFMSGKEIVGGVGNNKFDPKGSTSIEQALVIALKMLEKLK